MSSLKKSFVDEFSLNAFCILSFILIENNASWKQVNENSQANNTALTKWKNEEFSKKIFFDKNNHDCINRWLTRIKKFHF
jgi:hypothetical protein